MDRNYQDILYEVRNGAAWITINRPDKMNAFRGQTCDELIHAINRAGYDRVIGATVLAGAGDRAFSTGGDQSAHERPVRWPRRRSACRWRGAPRGDPRRARR